MNYIINEFTDSQISESHTKYEDDNINILTYDIIGAAMEVHKTIGKGFLESVYKDCLRIEFDNRKILFEKEKKFEIIYKGIKIPRHYCADFLIENKVVIEIKAQSNLIEENVKQLLNYLAVSKCKLGLLINFGENSLKTRRFILT